MADDKEKSIYDKFLSGFKPASARADEDVSENRKIYGDQFQKDKESGEARKKFIKGFYDR